MSMEHISRAVERGTEEKKDVEARDIENALTRSPMLSLMANQVGGVDELRDRINRGAAIFKKHI